MSISSKKEDSGKCEGGSASKKRPAHKLNQNDEELARKMNEELNVGYSEANHPEAHEHPTSGNSEDIELAIKGVQRYAEDVLNTNCSSCGRRLIRELHVSQWTERWYQIQGAVLPLSASGYRCKCGVTTCLGCGMKARVGDPRYTSDYQGLKLDYCCSKGGVFIAWVVLSRYDDMELHLQERSRYNAAITYQWKETLEKNPFQNRVMANGTGYGSDWRTSPFQFVTGHDPKAADESYRRPGLRQALDFRQADEETDSATNWILGMLIELLPRRDQPMKKVSPIMASMIELSLLQDRVAELLRNDSLREVNRRAPLYFATFEFVARLGHHTQLDYLVCEERFVKKQSAGLRAIATAAGCGKGKGKGKTSEQEILTVSSKSEGMAPSLLSCLTNLATQSKFLLSGSNNAAAGERILEVAQRINQIYSGLTDEGKTTIANITTWNEYHRAHCLIRRPNVAKQLCPLMAKLALQVTNPDKGRMARLVAETTEMITSLPDGIFVMVDEVRSDVMKVFYSYHRCDDFTDSQRL